MILESQEPRLKNLRIYNNEQV